MHRLDLQREVTFPGRAEGVHRATRPCAPLNNRIDSAKARRSELKASERPRANAGSA